VGIELGQVLLIGGPTSVVTAIFVILVNAYLAARKDRREQQAADVSTDSAIIDNAKKVLDIVRSEAERMDKENKAQDVIIAAQGKALNENADTIARQNRVNEWLTEDLQKANTELARLRGEASDGASPTT
jgi:hypothetical protein